MKNFLRIGLVLLLFAGAAHAVTYPTKSVANPLTQTIYVPNNSAAPAEIRIYTETGTDPANPWLENKTAKISLPSPTAQTYGLAVSADGKQLFVSINDAYQSGLKIYDLDSNGVPTGTFQTAAWKADPSDSPAGLALAPDGNRVYMADMRSASGSASVLIFDYFPPTTLSAGYWKKTGEITAGLTGLLGVYDVAVGPAFVYRPDPATYSTNYPIFVSRKVNSSTSKELFMYDHSVDFYTGDESITLNASVDAAYPTNLKVTAADNSYWKSIGMKAGQGKLYAAVKEAGANVRIYDYDLIPGTLVEHTKDTSGSDPVLSPINNSRANDYGWEGIDLSPASNKLQLYFTDALTLDESLTKIFCKDLANKTTPAFFSLPGVPEPTAPTSDALVFSPDSKYVIATNSWTGEIHPYLSRDAMVQAWVTAFAPTSTSWGADVTINVTGKNFIRVGSTTISQAKLIDNITGAVYTMGTTVITPTSLTAKLKFAGSTIPNETRKYRVNVWNGESSGIEIPDLFTIYMTDKPVVTKVYPNKAPNNVDTPIVIEGNNFITGSTVVLKTPAPMTLTSTVDSFTKIEALVPKSISPGTYDVVVSTSVGASTASSADAFTVILPGSDTASPETVANFTAGKGEDKQATLKWTNPASGDLREVIVQRITGGTAYPASHKDGTTVYDNLSPNPGTDVTTVDASLTNGTTYYYAVFSRDTSGNWNDAVVPGKNADTGTPGVAAPSTPPLNLTATKSGNDVILKWSAPTGGEPTGGYRIYRGTSPTVITIKIGVDVAPKTYTLTDTGAVTTPDSYYYVAKAFNGATESGPSNMAVLSKQNLKYNDPTSGLANKHWVSIPYKTPYTDAKSILLDLNGDDGKGNPNSGPITKVSRWNPDTQVFESATYNDILGWLYDPGPSPFPINIGEGFEITINKDATIALAGTHDPVFNFNLKYHDPTTGLGNKYWLSIPIESNYGDGSKLVNDINGGKTVPGTTTKITRWNPTTQNFESVTYNDILGWLNDPGPGAFPIVKGEAFEVTINADTTWKPAVTGP